MNDPLLPPNEPARVAALHRYRILDTPADPAFDDIVSLAAQICETPVAAVGFVDQDRVWFKARRGVAASQFPRRQSWLALAVLDSALVCWPDVRKVPELPIHPRDAGERAVRFLAIMPLEAPNGLILGGLYVADHRPRRLSPSQQEALRLLARQVTTQLELHEQLGRLEETVARHEQSEAALRAAEERYRGIFENVVEGIFQTTPDGHYLSANPKLAQIYGYTSAEDLIAALQDIRQQLYVDPKRRDEFIRRVQEEGEVSRFESQVFRKDGEVIWISENARTVRTAEGGVFYYEGTVEDITERKRAEKALEESELLYHSLVESLPQNVFRKDRDGKLTFVNHLFCQTLNRPREALIGRTDDDLFRPDLAAQYKADDQWVMEQQQALDKVEDHVLANGESLFVHVIKVPLYDTQGNVVGLQGMFWDETRRWRAESELAHERELLRALLDNVPDSIYFKDRDSRFLRCSLATARKFGLGEPSALLGKSDFDFFTSDHARAAYEDEQRIIRTGQPIFGVKERETWPDGSVTYVLTSKLPLRDATGDIVGTFGISREVTDLVQAERELAEARDAALDSARLKAQFLANMSHEIRTPMNAVIGMAGLLLDSKLTADQRDCVETIYHSGRALLEIINQILDFSRLEARRLKLEEVSFDLREVVEETVEMLADSAQRKGIELLCWVQDDLPTRVRGDRGRLRQVIVNLLGNAIKFTEQGEVVLRVTPLEETDTEIMVRGEVTDTGIGISESDQNRLFQAFSQTDNSNTRRYGGTGLGLAISRQIAELMGGEIGVESHYGAGSVFWFTARFAKQPDATVTLLAHASGLAGRRVLLLEENATSHRILLRMLGNWQARATGVASGAEALNELLCATHQGDPYELFLLAFPLSDMDGLGLAEAIRSEPLLDPLHLVLLTSWAGRLDRHQLRSLGIAAALPKPVRTGRLLDTLVTILDQKVPPLIGETAAPTGEEALATVGTAPKPRILLAEDNPLNQKLALRQLRHLGYYDADAVGSGVQVLEALKHQSYQVLLLDCQMPDMDGFETARRIRSFEAEAGHRVEPLHIIAMTANAMPEDRERCLNAGMDDYVSKPVELADLQAALLRLEPTPPPPSIAPPPPKARRRQTSAPMNQTAPVDLTVLHGLIGQEETGPEAAELIRLFLHTAEQLCSELQNAVANRNSADVRSAAHSLKGSARNLGAQPLADLAARMEKLGKEGSLTEVQPLMTDLLAEFARVRTALADELGRASQSP